MHIHCTLSMRYHLTPYLHCTALHVCALQFTLHYASEMYNFTLALHCISQNILQYTLYCAYPSVHYSALPQCTVLYCTLYSTERKISLQCIYHSPLLHSVLCTLWDTSSPFCIMNCTALCGNVGGWEGWGGHITHVSLQMTYALILLYTVLYSVSSSAVPKPEMTYSARNGGDLSGSCSKLRLSVWLPSLSTLEYLILYII